MQDERLIELIAKGLDETLSPAEQDELDRAMQESVALRMVAEALNEFDALLRRMGMAIPDEGFPARFLARLELYERRRSRISWILTLVIILVAWIAAVVWVLSNAGVLIETLALTISTAVDVVPVLINEFFVLINMIGRGPLLIYAFIVLALTWLWGRVSLGHTPGPTEVEIRR